MSVPKVNSFDAVNAVDSVLAMMKEALAEMERREVLLLQQNEALRKENATLRDAARESVVAPVGSEG